MKRDMDFIRHVLIETERAETPLPFEHFISDSCSMDKVSYHIQLMQHHGLVDVSGLRADNEVYYARIDGLTWDGFDYLEAIRSDSVWKKTKEVVSGSVGSTTLDVIKQIAVLLSIQAIKSYAGIS